MRQAPGAHLGPGGSWCLDSPGQWSNPRTGRRRRGGRDGKSWVKAKIAFCVLKVSDGTVISRGGALSDVCKGRGRDSRQGLPILSKPSLGKEVPAMFRELLKERCDLTGKQALGFFPKPIIAASLVKDTQLST